MQTQDIIGLRAAKDIVRQPYAWPGGYPRYLVMVDGGALCSACCRSEFRNIADSAMRGISDGWRPYDSDINWESPDLYCDHCNKRIESAYAEPEEESATRVHCDSCEMLSINGIACHETGCPNARKTWCPERESWILFVDCRVCGDSIEAGECCNCDYQVSE